MARLFIFESAVSLAWDQKAYCTIVQFPVNLPGIFLLRVTLASRGNSASKNLPCKASRLKCCLYETLYNVAAPIREAGDVITHLRGPDFFVFTSDASLRDPSQSCTGSYVLFFFKEATCKSSTIIGLLYAHEALIVTRRYDVPRD